jgi:16S rRNA (cytosine967-C5)-methyltransferase
LNLFAARESKKVIASELEIKTGVRKLAAEILLKVDSRKAYADILLDNALTTEALSAKDRALLTEIVYGTLRWRGRIDACLKPLMRRSLRDTDLFLLNLLRLAVYQLVFLDRVPAYAALNEAIEIAKGYAGEKAGGFINGVLRHFLRAQKPQPKPQPTSVAALAEYWSHPIWLVKKWLAYAGTGEIEDWLRVNNEEPPLVVRANLLKGTRDGILELFRKEGIEVSPTACSPQGITLHSRLPVDQIPGYGRGLFQVQGESSQLVTTLLAPEPGESILDACAAPGGKTTHIAELMRNTGRVVATDIAPKGIEKIKDNIVRLGLSSILTSVADASEELPPSLCGPYDRILIDAPCSGLGTVRSHPEIKWHRTESDIRRLARLQRKILCQTASYLKPSGILVYSTCTLTEEENEGVVEEFLAGHKEFVLEDAAGYLPEQAKLLLRGGYFVALPHRLNSDGFFAARMRKVI